MSEDKSKRQVIAVPQDTDEATMQELRSVGYLPIRTAFPDGLRLHVLTSAVHGDVLLKAAFTALSGASYADRSGFFDALRALLFPTPPQAPSTPA